MPLLLPFYKDRDTPVHRLHPAAKMATVMAVVVAALAMTHPNYLLALLAGTIIVAGAGRVLREWWAFMRLFALIALVVVVINTLVSSRGETTFWEGPYVWGFGQLSISMEGVVAGMVMALRLYVVVAAFTIVSLTVHPDEFTQLLARFAYRSGLAVSLATRFYPRGEGRLGHHGRPAVPRPRHGHGGPDGAHTPAHARGHAPLPQLPREGGGDGGGDGGPGLRLSQEDGLEATWLDGRGRGGHDLGRPANHHVGGPRPVGRRRARLLPHHPAGGGGLDAGVAVGHGGANGGPRDDEPRRGWRGWMRGHW